MPDIEIGLGQAVLRSRKSAVCLDLESSATFAATKEDDLDQLRRAQTTKHSTDTTHERPWVRCGDTFKFALSVHAGDLLDADGRDELRETLSGRFQQAKVLLMRPFPDSDH